LQKIYQILQKSPYALTADVPLLQDVSVKKRRRKKIAEKSNIVFVFWVKRNIL
jgi:hypothetical protein